MGRLFNASFDGGNELLRNLPPDDLVVKSDAGSPLRRLDLELDVGKLPATTGLTSTACKTVLANGGPMPEGARLAKTLIKLMLG